MTLVIFTSKTASSQNFDLVLDMSNPADWVIDEVHLGSRQIDISYDSSDDAVVMMPTWSKDDLLSPNVAISNIENGHLHTYQLMNQCDCTQSEIRFEINMPQAFIDEAKVE